MGNLQGSQTWHGTHWCMRQSLSVNRWSCSCKRSHACDLRYICCCLHRRCDFADRCISCLYVLGRCENCKVGPWKHATIQKVPAGAHAPYSTLPLLCGLGSTVGMPLALLRAPACQMEPEGIAPLQATAALLLMGVQWLKRHADAHLAPGRAGKDALRFTRLRNLYRCCNVACPRSQQTSCSLELNSV